MKQYILSVCSGDYTNNEIDTNCFGLFDTEEEAKDFALYWVESQKEYYRKIYGDDDDDRYEFYYIIKTFEDLETITNNLQKRRNQVNASIPD